jgi:hypothetical protein
MKDISAYQSQIDYAKLDDGALEAEFNRAKRERDKVSLEPVVCQLTLRAAPVIAASVSQFASLKFSERDRLLIEREALTKFLLRLQSTSQLSNSAVIAHEIGRECAEDPDRIPCAPRVVEDPRPRLRVLPGGQLLRPSRSSKGGGSNGRG